MKTQQEIKDRLAELLNENAVYHRMASKDLSPGAFLAAIKERINDKQIKILKWVLNEEATVS
jgi:hypothetical protein